MHKKSEFFKRYLTNVSKTSRKNIKISKRSLDFPKVKVIIRILHRSLFTNFVMN